MVKKCSEQKNMTLKMKTCQKYKRTPDNYSFHPNLLHKIFGRFLVVFYQYGWKIFRSKVQIFMHKNSQKVANQHMMTCFCTQTMRTLFLVILLFFSINTVRNLQYLKYSTVCTKTYQKWKPTQDDYVFHPHLSYIIFSHFVIVSLHYASKIQWSKV